MKRINSLVVLGLFSIFGISNLNAQIQFQADATDGCAPFNVNFTNISDLAGLDTTNLNFQWDFNNDGVWDDTSYNSTFIYLKPGNYSIYVEAFDRTNGGGCCSWNSDFSINVYGVPDTFRISTGQSACPNEKIYFETIGDVNPRWMKWEYGDGTFSSWNYTDHTYDTPGNYEVLMIMEAGGNCPPGIIDTARQTININSSAIPTKPDAGSNGGNQFCPGDEVTFWLGYSNIYDSVSWHFGDGTTSDELAPVHSYTVGGKQVIVEVFNSCGNSNADTFNVQILTNIVVDPNFNYWYNSGAICPGNQVNFNANGTGTYLWDFGNGETSSMKTPEYFFVDTGAFKIKLLISNNCGFVDSSEQTLIVNYDPFNNPPGAYINFDINNKSQDTTISVCPNEIIPFRNNTWSNDGIVYKWEFGDGQTSEETNISHSWMNPGTYNVLMIATNNCQASDTASLEVIIDANIQPNTQITVLQDSICPGEEMYFVPDDRSMKDGLFTFSLWYGDGQSDLNMSMGNNPNIGNIFTHTYASTNDYIYRIEATNLCGNTDTVLIDTLSVSSNITNPFLMLMSSASKFEDPTINLIPDWSTRQSVNDYELTIPVTWSGWQESYQDNFYLAFFFENPQNGNPPSSLVKFIGPGEATAYIPTDAGYDSVWVSAIWTCDGILNGDINVSGDYNNTVQLIQSGVDTLPFPGIIMNDNNWDGTCNDYSSCPGDTVSFMAIGGIAYDWDFGDLSTTTGQLVKHIYADTGKYNVDVVITSGCGNKDTSSITVIVGDYNTPDATFYLNNDNVCVGDTISFQQNNNGGDGPVEVYNNTYLWDFGDGKTSIERDPLHVYQDAGSYEVSLTVTNGCGSSKSQIRTVFIDGPIINFSVADTTVLQGNPLSFINETQNAVSFIWNFGNDSSSIQKNPTEVYSTFGQYNVSLTATSIRGCVTSLVKTNYLLVLNTPSISTSLVTDIKCNSDNNGAIDITVTGGQPPYTYIWSNAETTQDIDALAPATYTVTITDNFGTEIIEPFVVTEPNALVNSMNITNVNCFGGSDGIANANITGGTGNYTYLWSTNGNSNMISGLSEGKYYLTVTDENDCMFTDSASIVSNNPEINLTSLFSTSTSSCGAADGSVDASGVSGGTASYSYAWDILPDPGDVASVNGSLLVGTYSVTVTDGVGCVDSASISVADGGSSTLNIWEQKAITCDEGSDGEVTVNSSGTPTLYEWSVLPDPGSVSTVSGLSAGTYSVTVTEGACKGAISITLNNPDTLIVQISGLDPTCPGGSTGEATANATGGRGNYNYEWPFGWNQQSNINLMAGTYSVTVTDNFGSGCAAIQSITLNDPPAMTVSTDMYDAAVRDSADGAINLTVHDGTAPYSYQWSNGDTTQDVDNIPAGTYDVTVTDANVCQGIFTGHLVNEPALLNVDIVANRNLPLCMGETVNLDAGAGYVQYQWSTGETNQTITADTGMVYYVKAIGNTSYGYDTLDVVVQYPFTAENICVVTIDIQTGKNAIVWEKTLDVGTAGFKVYRESDIVGIYDSIGYVDIDSLSVFVDTETDPKAQQILYKISVVDTCGNESKLSNFHKPVFLQFVNGQLSWQNYEIEGGADIGFTTYEIWRGSDSTSLTKIHQQSTSTTVYSDQDPDAASNIFYYRIAGIKSDTCDPAGLLGKKANAGPFSRSLSNLEDNRQQVNNIENDMADKFKLSVYPNPYSSFTTITYSLNATANIKMQVYDLVGKKVADIVNETQSQGSYSYKFSAKEFGLPSGLYYLNLETDNYKTVKKLIEIQ